MRETSREDGSLPLPCGSIFKKEEKKYDINLPYLDRRTQLPNHPNLSFLKFLRFYTASSTSRPNVELKYLSNFEIFNLSPLKTL